MKKGRSKRKKFFKELKKELEEFKFTKHHFYYTALVLIIFILTIFLFNNYNKCNLYEINMSKNDFSVKNGVLILTGKDNILRLSNISYSGELENVTSVDLSLYVKGENEDYTLNTFGRYSAEGFLLNEYLDGIKFEVDETKNNIDVFTKKVRNLIKDNLYLRISVTDLEGNVITEELNLKVDSLYSNSKLFY